MAMVRIINDHGTTLIDADVPPLALRQTNTITATGWSTPMISLSGLTSPVFAIRPMASQGAYMSTVYGSGGSRNVIVGIEANTPDTPSPADSSVRLYTFDRVTDSGANWGMKVWNAQGQLVFDALRKFGRIVGELNGNGTWTGTAGRTYAAVISSRRDTEEIRDSLSQGWKSLSFWRTGVSVANHVVTIRDVLISRVELQTSTPVGITKQFGSPSALILDVTGY